MGADSKSIFNSKVATGFSNIEEEQINKVKVSPACLIAKVLILMANRISRS